MGFTNGILRSETVRNPLAVFLFSMDHQSGILCKIYAKIGLYNVIAPTPFEHYCIFCRRISYEWWKDYKPC